MEHTDIAVVGAGPAGLSAAIAAAGHGARVGVFDEGQKPGGQLFKQIHKFFGSHQHKAGVRGFRIGTQLLEEAGHLGIAVELQSSVLGVFDGNRLVVQSPGGVKTVTARRIILATGANENHLCFEGSTLPGVMTAGAAQTMINEHRVLPGKRVVMVGSGNVGLIISYQLLQAGAQVAALVEAGDTLGGYAVHAGKLRRAGVPFHFSTTVSRAIGDKEVEAVELVRLDQSFQPIAGTQTVVEADTVCCAVGLSPMVELAALLGCRMTSIPALGGTVPVHDADMRTTNPDVFVAGDIAGVEEASTAMEEGRLAGVAAAESLGLTTNAAGDKEKARAALAVLRSGAFGDKRFAAKSELIRQAEKGVIHVAQ